MDRGVERVRRRQADFRTDAERRFVARRGPPGRRVSGLASRERRGGNHFARQTRAQLRNNQQRVFFEDPLARFERRPGHRDADAADAAPEQDAHAEILPALEPDTLKRKTNLHRVTGLVDAAGAVPDPVRRQVFAAGDAVQHVHLDAARVHHHVIRQLAGPERIEAQSDPVVAPHVVAPRDRRLDARRLGIVALEREIKIIIVVRHPHGGALRDAIAV